ncbi:MAG: hypothetical protein ACLU9Q_13750 [Marvinbryantia sp.]|uniref:hypothetical protein n=1 Tax=Marvinbryantia sp. TaxID=2496532 RepID=UPI00399A114A
MKIQVLMAVKEGIARGKRIDFALDEKSSLYIASCEGKAFGVAKKLLHGRRRHLKNLSNSFSGVAVKVSPESRNMEVKIMRERRGQGTGKNCLG